MIKAQAKICGVISQNAAVRQAKDSHEFLGFAVRLAVPGSRKGSPGKEVLASVSVDGSRADAAKYIAGKRFEAEGLLAFRKSGESLCLNFHAAQVKENPSEQDAIEGTLEFKGTVGKSVDEKTASNGSKFVSFSAYSTEKAQDGFTFIWVRFLKFDIDKPAFLAPKAKIVAKGALEVTAYKGNVSLGCRLDEARPWVRMPFNQQNDNEIIPF